MVMYYLTMVINRVKLPSTVVSNRTRLQSITKSKIANINKHHRIPKHNNIVCVKSSSNELVTMSYLIGKGIIAFTFFYTSLNYLHYKRLREEYDENNKGDDKN